VVVRQRSFGGTEPAAERRLRVLCARSVVKRGAVPPRAVSQQSLLCGRKRAPRRHQSHASPVYRGHLYPNVRQDPLTQRPRGARDCLLPRASSTSAIRRDRVAACRLVIAWRLLVSEVEAGTGACSTLLHPSLNIATGFIATNR